MNFYWKLAITIAIAATIFCSGMYTEAKFHLASVEKAEAKEVIKAQTAQTDIIKFNTKIQKVYVKVKSPCINTSMPDDIKRLLK